MKSVTIKSGICIILSLFLVSCKDGETSFASLAPQLEEPFQQEIASLVEEEVAISRGKSKKGESIKPEETVGQKDLEIVNVTLAIKEVQKPELKPVPRPVLTPVAEPVVKQKPVVRNNRKQVDILFYLTPSVASYNHHWVSFYKAVGKNGFLSQLKSKSWQVGISLFSEKEKSQLAAWEKLDLKFRQKTGSKYEYVRVLTSEYNIENADTILKNSLRNEQETHTQSSGYYDLTDDGDRNVQDILGGLTQLLSENTDGLFRKDSKKVHVFLFDNNYFPYYTSKEWGKFFRKHKNLKLHIISPRVSNVSNFEHALEKYSRQIDWTSLTDDPKNLPEELVDLIN